MSNVRELRGRVVSPDDHIAHCIRFYCCTRCNLKICRKARGGGGRRMGVREEGREKDGVREEGRSREGKAEV